MTRVLIDVCIYESIFKPGIFSEFKVLDLDDALGGLVITGDETLIFEFHKLNATENPNNNYATYVFVLNSVTLLQGAGGLYKARTYTIEAVSWEVVASRVGPIYKQWTAPISSVVDDTFHNHLGSQKHLFNEPSAGAQKLIARGEKPFSWIDTIRRRAISSAYGPSPYMFFENRDGYHFETLAGMQDTSTHPVVKAYRQVDTVGHNMNSDIDHNIIHFTIVSHVIAEARARMGTAGSQVDGYNLLTRESSSQSSKPGSTFNSDVFKQVLGAKPGASHYMPTSGNIPRTGLPSGTPGIMAGAANMMQLIVMVHVMGEPILQAGKLVDLLIPKQVNVSVPQPPDNIVSGTFLISKLKHHIASANVKPRYTTVIEGLKGTIEGA